MQKIAGLLLGFYMVYLGIEGMLTGNVSSLGGTVTTSGGPTNVDDSPVQFIITVIITISIGVWLIYIAIFNRNDNDENE